MRIDPNVTKDTGKMETTSPYFQMHYEIMNSLSNKSLFYTKIESASKKITEMQTKTSLYHWVEIVNFLDDEAKECLLQLEKLKKEASTVPASEMSVSNRLMLILRFFQNLLSRSRNKLIFNSTQTLLEVLRLDDWTLVLQGLMMAIAIVDKTNSLRGDGKGFGNKELETWLLNTAFGYSLKNKHKYNFSSVLRDSSLIKADLYFQFNIQEAGKGIPSLISLRLKELYEDPRPSQEIAQEILEKYQVPIDLFPALWCKVRLAKTVTTAENLLNVVKASLLSYIAFVFGTTENSLANAFLETEPKVRLIPNLIQLFKETVPPQIHCLAFQVLNALLFCETNPHIEVNLFPIVINQIGILSPNGLLQGIIKDISSLRFVPAIPETRIKYFVESTPEVLPQETAEMSGFAMSVLTFLSSFERITIHNRSFFMNGLVNSICNFLLVPLEGHYPYHLPVEIKAMSLLYKILRHNIGDYTATGLIINRLCVELKYLKLPERELCYAARTLDKNEELLLPPKLQHRQNLCIILFKLLGSSIHLSVQRNPLVQNAITGHAQSSELQRCLNLQHRRDRQKATRRRLNQPEEPVQEEDPEQEEEEKEDSIVVSRRILESRLIELSTEVFAITHSGVSEAYDSVSYAALALISSIIKDIPTSVPDLISRGLIPAIISCYLSRIPIEENCLRVIFRGINAIILHQEGAKLIHEKTLIHKVLLTLTREESTNLGNTPFYDYFEDLAKQILNLYSQSDEILRAEIVNGIKSVYLGIYMRFNSVLEYIVDGIGGDHYQCQKVIERCHQYEFLLKSALQLLVCLIQNVDSADHQKMLSAINTDSSLIKNILMLYRVSTMLSIFIKSARQIHGHFSQIIRRFIKEVFEHKENSEAILSSISEHIKENYAQFGDVANTENFLKFLSVEKILGTKKQNPCSRFSHSQQLRIVLNELESECEIIKHFGISVLESEGIIAKLNDLHKLLLREIIRLCQEKKCYDAIKADETLLNRFKEHHPFESYIHFFIPFSSEYELQLEQTYHQLRKSFLYIMKMAVTRRQYDSSDENHLKIIKNIAHTVKGNLQNLASDLKDVDKSESSSFAILYKVMVIDDIRITLFYDVICSRLIHECLKLGILEDFVKLYRWAVQQYLLLENIEFLGSGLSTLITILLSCFEKLLDPIILKKSGTDSGFSEAGCESYEDYIASSIVYIWRSIFFNTQYSPYKSCIQFYSITNKQGFELLLNLIKTYRDQRTVSGLFASRDFKMNFGIRTRPRGVGNIEPVQSEYTYPPLKSPERHSTVHSFLTEKTTAKELQGEIDEILRGVLRYMIEGIYSVGKYKCKFLIIDLLENYDNSREGKCTSMSFFHQLINELQLILCGIELSYKPNIQELQEPIVEIIGMIEKETDAEKRKETALVHIEVLLDMLQAFLNYSSNAAEMNQYLYTHEFSRFLVNLISVVCKELSTHKSANILSNLLSKSLLMLTLLYEEIVHNYQMFMLDTDLKQIAQIKEDAPEKPPHMPLKEDISLLLQGLVSLLEINDNSKVSTNEILTLILSLIFFISKDSANIPELCSKTVISKMFLIKKTELRNKLPLPLIQTIMLNFCEASEMFNDYSRRIISHILYSRSVALVDKTMRKHIHALKDKSAVKIDTFLEQLQFLMQRNPRVFTKNCKSVMELRQEIQKGEINNIIQLRNETIIKIRKDKKDKIPEVPLKCNEKHQSPKIQGKTSPPNDSPEKKNIMEYREFLKYAIKEEKALIPKSVFNLISSMLDRLINLHFASQNASEAKIEYLINGETLIDLIGEMLRVYPELMSILLIHPKISGTTLISFLLRSVAPQKFLREVNGKLEIFENEFWKNRFLQFIKNIIYENPNLHNKKQRIIISELRRRIILELLIILSNNLDEKKPMDLKAYSVVFSSLSIIEGILSSVNYSIQLSVFNVNKIINIMQSDDNFQLIRLSAELLKSLNMNAIYAELLMPKLTKILERLSRKKSTKEKMEEKEDSKVPVGSEEFEDLQSMAIDPREIAEREDELGGSNSDSLSIYSDEYHGGESGSEAIMAEEGMFPAEFDLDVSDSDEEEEAEEMKERSEDVDMDDNNDQDMVNEIEEGIRERFMEEEDSDNDDGDILQQYESENASEIDMDAYYNSSELMSGEQYQDESEDENGFLNSGEIVNLIPPIRNESIFRQDSEEIDIHFRIASSGDNRNIQGAHINIDSPPINRRDMQYSSIAELYEHYNEEDINRHVIENIRPETLGTENIPSSGLISDRYSLQMRNMNGNRMPVLLGYPRTQQGPLSIKKYQEKKRSLLEIVKKQLTEGGLMSVMVNKDNEKPPEEETKKTGEKKEEEKKNNPPRSASKLPEDIIAQRRLEFASIVPNIQVEDSLLSEIDFDFLRALPEPMRHQAVEPFIQPPQNPAGPFLLNDDFSLFSLVGNQDMGFEQTPRRGMLSLYSNNREGEEKKKKEEQKKTSEEFLKYLYHCDHKLTKHLETSMVGLVDFSKCVDEKIIESIIKLLYLNAKTKMPINALIGNLCYNKKQTGKILDILLFILVHYNAYEKKKTSEITHSEDQVSIIALTDSIFPPLSLYNSLESMHLTYYIVALRVLSLLSSLLKIPNVIHSFFPIKGEKQNFSTSITKLRKELALKFDPPIREVLELVNNKLFRTSVLHLDMLVQLIIGLLEKFNESRKKVRGERKPMPVVTPEIAKLIFKFYFLDSQNEKACSRMTALLLNLASEEEDEKCIFNELQKLIFRLCEELLSIWKKEIAELISGKIPKTALEDENDEVSIELKLGRLFKILSNPEEDEEPPEFEFEFKEEDSMDEVSEIPVKIEEKKEAKLGPFAKGDIVYMFKQPIINQTFFVLTELLTYITANFSKIGIATTNQLLFKLVPAIESMMIAYDKIFSEAKTFRSIIREITEAKKLKEKYTFKSVISHTLYNLIEQNNKTINNLIRQIEIQSFLSVVKPFIIRFPSFLDFDNKRAFFRTELRKLKNHSLLRVTVSRSNVFIDSYNQLSTKPVEDIMGKIRVTLKGEDAVDAGGVTREWFTVLSKAMFNPDFCFFKQSAHGNTYQPDAKSVIDENHISFFHFIGRIIGKAILDGYYLDCHFTRAFYKIIVGQTLNIHDLEDYDLELFKGLEWVRDNDPEDLECTFSYSFDYFGEVQTRDLIDNGRNIKVTNSNKHDFIVKTCKAKLYDEIKSQMESLLKGLYEIVPKKHISLFDHREIELLMSGLPDIDIFDLRRNTEYHGYIPTEETIEWFWVVMEAFSRRERAEFLQFVTGSSMVPLGGFKNLQGAVGIQRFQIHKAEPSVDRLPTAHTCFNQLDLPRYPSKEVLQDRLLKAIKEGADFMGLF